MLEHSCLEWCIIILSPSTKWVKEENWIFESDLEELLSCVIQEKDVTVVKRVSHLESINCISTFSFNLGSYLLRGNSVLIKSIIEFDSLDKSGSWSWYEHVSLCHDSFNLGVFSWECTEDSGWDLFLSVIKEDWVFNDCEDIWSKSWWSDGNSLFSL